MCGKQIGEKSYIQRVLNSAGISCCCAYVSRISGTSQTTRYPQPKQWSLYWNLKSKTGVVTLGDSGPTLALRAASMLAWCMETTNRIRLRFKNEGAMHACGHDFHTALGAVQVLKGKLLQGSSLFSTSRKSNQEHAHWFLSVLEGRCRVVSWHRRTPVGTIGVKGRTIWQPVRSVSSKAPVQGVGARMRRHHTERLNHEATPGNLRTLKPIVARHASPLEPVVLAYRIWTGKNTTWSWFQKYFRRRFTYV